MLLYGLLSSTKENTSLERKESAMCGDEKEEKE
jgi:hypothetical protein